MNRYTEFELKAASFIFGILEMWLALVVGLDNSADPLHRVLASSGRDNDWSVILFVLGLMVAYGAMRPKRKCRHIGLTLSVFMLSAIFGLILQAAALTFTTGLVFVLAAVAVILLTMDIVLGQTARSEHLHAQGH